MYGLSAAGVERLLVEPTKLVPNRTQTIFLRTNDWKYPGGTQVRRCQPESIRIAMLYQAAPIS
jgi:hypothetical protein